MIIQAVKIHKNFSGRAVKNSKWKTAFINVLVYLGWLYLKINFWHPQDFLFVVNKRFRLSSDVVRRLKRLKNKRQGTSFQKLKGRAPHLHYR